MARTGSLDGFDIRIGLRIPNDVASWIILNARTRRVPESLVVVEALRRVIAGEVPPRKPVLLEVLESIRGVEPPAPPPDLSVAPRKAGRPKGPEKVKTRPGPRPAPTAPTAITLRSEAYGWTWERLVAALSTIGLSNSHKALALGLGLTNISIWKKSGIPSKWHAPIHAWLLDQGWKPESVQATIFD